MFLIIIGLAIMLVLFLYSALIVSGRCSRNEKTNNIHEFKEDDKNEYRKTKKE